jgi:hypothetical protein
MLKRSLFYLLTVISIASCNNSAKVDKQPSSADSPATATATVPADTAHATEQASTLPAFVVFKNWEMGDPANAQLVVNTYNAWDSDSTGTMSGYFGDTTHFDLPDGRRFTMSNKTIESTLRKWRKNYKATSNIPFSVIPLHNKDRDQQWVLAWTWNKWKYSDGSKDSMLYFDNWRLKDGKIVYLNSSQNKPSKSLLKTLSNVPEK